ncbi:hypothetical protein DFH06DRAFT_167845 [Mycena polygramma]|nr:hypothetical protein DFH06DRAFT_167845 [Mycena polygramma]
MGRRGRKREGEGTQTNHIRSSPTIYYSFHCILYFTAGTDYVMYVLVLYILVFDAPYEGASSCIYNACLSVQKSGRGEEEWRGTAVVWREGRARYWSGEEKEGRGDGPTAAEGSRGRRPEGEADTRSAIYRPIRNKWSIRSTDGVSKGAVLQIQNEDVP